jgi:hypothetical protein
MLSPQRSMSDPERRSFNPPKIGSNRNFGILLAVIFLIIGLWPIVSGDPIRAWSLLVAALLLAAALILPHSLAPLNKGWFQFGLLLGKVLTPIVMGVLFSVAIVPAALILRLLGKDILRLRSDPALGTYWLPKLPPGPTPESLKDQF